METKSSTEPTIPPNSATAWQSPENTAKQDSNHYLSDQTDPSQWFAMRDLKRPNAKTHAWQLLSDKGFTVFTPLKWVTETIKGKKTRRQVPFITDLLFVRSTKADLDPQVQATPTLQYRYAKGAQAKPITVRDDHMNTFVTAVTNAPDTKYYLPGELSPAMIGRRILIVGGPLEGYTGTLLSIRGTRTPRLLVDLPGILTAAVEVSPEYIQLA
ncbi:MAG: UpxY family transcription antiterminator [Paramuribaculum sp.]|nr:UpxY family transcription antiterminator [Paramuribaculum sp.]